MNISFESASLNRTANLKYTFLLLISILIILGSSMPVFAGDLITSTDPKLKDVIKIVESIKDPKTDIKPDKTIDSTNISVRYMNDGSGGILVTGEGIHAKQLTISIPSTLGIKMKAVMPVIYTADNGSSSIEFAVVSSDGNGNYLITIKLSSTCIGCYTGNYSQSFTNLNNSTGATLSQSFASTNITSLNLQNIVSPSYRNLSTNRCGENTTGNVFCAYMDEITGTLVQDYSGNGNNGTWSGNTSINSSTGKYNTGIVFDGVDDNVTISNINLSSVKSISLWANITNISIDNSGIFRSISTDLRWFKQGPNDWQLYMYNGSSIFRFRGVTPIENKLVNYVFVYTSDTTLNVYINNVLTSKSSDYNTTSVINNTFELGKDIVHIPGTIDEVQIYNRSLSASEIQQNYYAKADFFQAKTNSNTTYSSYWNNSSTLSIPYHANDSAITSISLLFPENATIDGVTVYDYVNNTRVNFSAVIGYTENTTTITELASSNIYNYNISILHANSGTGNITLTYTDSTFLSAAERGIPSLSTNNTNATLSYNDTHYVINEVSVDNTTTYWYNISRSYYTNPGNDEFNNETLNTTKWTWTNEGDWSMNGTSIFINSSATNLYGADHSAPQLLQNVTVGIADYISIETKINLTQINFEGGAGLIFKADDNNFVYGTYHTTVSNDEKVYFITNINGSGAYTSANVAENTSIILNITKNNISYSLYYRFVESESWTKVSSFEMKNPTTMGLIVTGVGSAGKNYSFDYFRVNQTEISIANESISSDEFNGTRINDWFDTNYYNDSITFTDTSMVISIPADTGTRDIWGGYSTPMVMQWTNNTSNYDITIKIDNNFSTGTQDHGLVFRSDIGTKLRFDIYTNGVFLNNYIAQMDNFTTTEINSIIIPETTIPYNSSFWMRVKKLNSTWVQWYSLDNTTWYKVKHFNNSINVTSVGIYGATASAKPAFNVTTDYFRVTEALPDTDAPVTRLFYGDYQRFGHIGNVQRYINLLGNTEDESNLSYLNYTLNAGANNSATLGKNNIRLEYINDFNVEIDTASLNCGNNTVNLTAGDINGYSSLKTVIVNYTCGISATMPYFINWSEETDIQDVVQVIDGEWNIGNRLNQTTYGYDRLVGFGNTTWQDFEVNTSIYIASPMSANAAANFGIIMRWHEHTGGDSPKSTWYPLGAIAAYIYRPELGTFKLSLLKGGSNESLPMTLIFFGTDNDTVLNTGIHYNMKARVQTINSSYSNYSLKVWEQNTTEPTGWNVSGITENTGDGLSNGSAGLVAYYADVSFGNVTVTDISSEGIKIPPTPVNLSSTQGNYWINYTWDTGIGNTTDSYRVNVNGTWTNGSLQNWSNGTVEPLGWRNISVWAYNNTGIGSLSVSSISNNTQLTQITILPPIVINLNCNNTNTCTWQSGDAT